ncbi:MAG TPA: alpha-1,2-fucosyltransferase [Pirellulaceae bacterium]|nr:alpha-1,2-fucosyltransferase [Pirellulaceae bacterium]
MSRGVVMMSKLGQLGRFANQLFQYMFLKTYALRHDLEVQTPPWIGQQLFGLADPPIAGPLPEFVELYDKDPQRMVVPRLTEPLRNVDFSGFFQYPTRYYAPQREYIRRLFTPVPEAKQPLDAAVTRLRERGRTLVALHIRRGDYGFRYFYVTPLAWYLGWLEQMWPTWESPLLIVATDEPAAVLPAFAAYRPVTAADLGLKLPIAPYFPDFYLLTQADVLAIPNSSFSFAAAMLNANLKAAWRSHLADPLGDPPFRTFDPWDADVLETGACAEDFPHISGITRPPKRKWWRVERALSGLFRSRARAA